MERNRLSPRRDEAAKPSRWWRSRWNGALPASQARNRFLGWRLWQWSPAQRPAACTDFSPSQSPTRQSGNQPWLARLPRAGAARLSAYCHALARRSGGCSSTLSLALHCSLPPEALSAGHAPQSRIATPSKLPGRIQLPAQAPHSADQSVSPPRAGLSHNPHGYLQGVNHRAGSSLIFIYRYFLTGWRLRGSNISKSYLRSTATAIKVPFG